ncbi:MAG: hypothetical protein LBR89_03165 [Holosporales bacterium]|nr:hypothetical protein [Holosporales bacterium]
MSLQTTAIGLRKQLSRAVRIIDDKTPNNISNVGKFLIYQNPYLADLLN